MKSFLVWTLTFLAFACGQRNRVYAPVDSKTNSHQSVMVMSDSAATDGQAALAERIESVSEGLGPDVLFLYGVKDADSLREFMESEFSQFHYSEVVQQLAVFSRYPLTLLESPNTGDLNVRISVNSAQTLSIGYPASSEHPFSIAPNAHFLHIQRLKGNLRPFVAEILVQ